MLLQEVELPIRQAPDDEASSLKVGELPCQKGQTFCVCLFAVLTSNT